MSHGYRTFVVLATLALVSVPLAAQGITVDIIKPGDGPTPDLMTIKATVSSTYQIQSVTAGVMDRTVALQGSGSDWSGEMSIEGLPRGPLQLTVTAQDVFGSTGSETVTFNHDSFPKLTVTAPLPYTVARPLMRVTATCTDDDPAGCVSLIVRRYDGSPPFATGPSSIDVDIALDEYEGEELTLTFEARDSANRTVTENRLVYVDSSARMQNFHEVTGRILDVQSNRILYVDQTETFLKIRDIAAGTDTNIQAISGKTPKNGFLTPRGAIFSVASSATDSVAYEWQDGVLLLLSSINSLDSLEVSGGYAIWTGNNGPLSPGNEQMFFRNILTGTTSTISPPDAGPGNIHHDVTEDGTIALWNRHYEVYLHENDAFTSIAIATGSYEYTYPLTDGTNTVFRRGTPCCAAPRTYAIVHHDGTDAVQISEARSAEPLPGRDYQVENGWIAVTRVGYSGEMQVFRLSPDDDAEQISFFSRSSRIDLLIDTGDLMWSYYMGPQYTDRQRFLTTVNPTETSVVGSALGKAFYLDGEWYVAIGRSLFKVTTSVTETTTTLSSSPNPSYAGQTVTFTATVSPSGATGSVSLKNGSATIGTATLSGGTATFSIESLAVGSHSLTAVYSGDGTFASSTSDTLTHDVRTATTTALSSSPNPSNAGQSVTFTATVSPSAATGTVTFYDGANSLGTGSLSGGTASLTTSALSAGTHSITATYSGNASYASSTSTASSQEVRTPFGAPTGLTATATTTRQVVVTWLGVTDASQYQVSRSLNGSSYPRIATVTGTTFTDNNVAPNTTYLYIVRSVRSNGSVSPSSGPDPATTVIFTDDPLAADVHKVRRDHLLQLRTAANAMRVAAGLPVVTFTDNALPAGSPIKALHVQEIRNALDAARTALQLAALTRTDSTLIARTTVIKAAHVRELRDGCR